MVFTRRSNGNASPFCYEALIRSSSARHATLESRITSLPPEYKAPLAAGRLLLLSPFPPKKRRVTAATTRARNHFVAEQADRVFIAGAAAGSSTVSFCRELLADGKPVHTFDSDYNRTIVEAGATTMAPADCRERFDDLIEVP